MRRYAVILGAGGLLAVLPFVVGTYWVGLLTQAIILGGFALGLDILIGFLRMPTLGHAVFFGLSGYGTALAIVHWGLNPWLAALLGFALSLTVAVSFAPIAVRARGITFLTVTLAFGQMAWGLATRWTSFTGGENGMPGIPRPDFLWDIQSPRGFYWLTLLIATVVTIVISQLAESPVGKSFLGMKDSDTRMMALGYNVRARRAVAFSIAAAVGAIYGVLHVFFNQFIGPNTLDWRLSAQLLLSVVVGGFGSLWGPFVAGAGLHVLRTTLVGSTQRWPLVLGSLYVIAVVFLPGGLASLPDRVRALRTTSRSYLSGRRRAPSEAIPAAPAAYEGEQEEGS